MTLPSKSGGFQLPTIRAASNQISVESSDTMYFDWAFTQYIQKVRHGEMKVGTVKIVSTFKKSVFCPMGPNFWACLNILKVGILQ